jgi:Uma2 family endonuclease
MAQAPKGLETTYDDYLEAARHSPVKLEFHAGEVFAMTGGSVLHARLGANVVSRLDSALRGKTCRAFNSELRITITAANEACYPDASVVCGPITVDPRDPHGVTNPSVIVEVLSPSTETYDRSGKFGLYRQIASLQDYLLVSQTHNQIEHFSKNADDSWTYRCAQTGDSVHLTAVDVALSVAEVFVDADELRALEGVG